MNCRKHEGLLVSYMDGRASAAERVEVDRHLLACAACRARVEEFGRLWNVLADAPALPLSSAFDARLLNRIAGEPQPSWRDWLPAPRLAFAAGLLLLLSVWVGNGPAPLQPGMVQMHLEDEIRAGKDLQALEDLDVLANFETLEVPAVQRKPSKL
jgi:anti-sigma factor RsiW